MIKPIDSVCFLAEYSNLRLPLHPDLGWLRLSLENMLRSAILVCLLVLLGACHPAASAQESPRAAAGEKPGQKAAKAAQEDKAATPPPTAAGQNPSKSSANDNPFPEEQSKSAAKQVEQGQEPPLPADLTPESPAPETPAKDRPSPGSSGSRPGEQPAEEGISSSRTHLEGLDLGDADAPSKDKPKLSTPVHNPKMSGEDVAIGKMYFQSENYRGAYIRYKEALALDPENTDAAFGVAEAARKLNQTKEAVENYQLCLDLDPAGPRAKAARKALNALSSVSHH